MTSGNRRLSPRGARGGFWNSYCRGSRRSDVRSARAGFTAAPAMAAAAAAAAVRTTVVARCAARVDRGSVPPSSRRAAVPIALAAPRSARRCSCRGTRVAGSEQRSAAVAPVPSESDNARGRPLARLDSRRGGRGARWLAHEPLARAVLLRRLRHAAVDAIAARPGRRSTAIRPIATAVGRAVRGSRMRSARRSAPAAEPSTPSPRPRPHVAQS